MCPKHWNLHRKEVPSDMLARECLGSAELEDKEMMSPALGFMAEIRIESSPGY